MQTVARLLFSLTLSVICASPGFADTPVTVVNPSVRLMPPNAKVSAAFMTLRNDGPKPIKIIGASNPASQTTEIHTHLNEGGLLKMRQIPGLEISPGESVTLQPGGLHLMLIGLKTPLREGETIPITLNLADGRQLTIDARVLSPRQ